MTDVTSCFPKMTVWGGHTPSALCAWVVLLLLVVSGEPYRTPYDQEQDQNRDRDSETTDLRTDPRTDPRTNTRVYHRDVRYYCILLLYTTPLSGTPFSI